MSKSSSDRLLWAVILASTLVTSCVSEPTGHPLEVEYTGCASVSWPGPRCQLSEDRQLRLWIPVPDRAIMTISDGSRIVEQQAVQQGQRLLVEITDGTQQLEILAEDGPRRATWSLTVEHRPQAQWWTEVRRLQVAGEPQQAEDILRSQLQSSAPAEDRGDVLYRLAGQVYRRGDTAEAQQLMIEAVAWYRQAERPLESIRSGTALSYWLHADGQWVEERQVLDSLGQLSSPTAEGSFLLHFFQGQLAIETGDLRTALRHLRASAEQAERVGLDRFRHQSEQLLANTLAQTGRRAEAASLLNRLAQDDAVLSNECERALFSNTLGWSRLLELEAGTEAEPLPALELAASLMPNCPGFEQDLANVYTNLSLAYLHADALDLSRDYLQRARQMQLRPQRRLLLWWQEIAARLALAGGAYDTALEHFADEARLAQEALVPHAHWRAELGTARTLWALDQQDDALIAFQQAEQLLDAEALRVPVGGDRAAFVAQREWASSLYLDALLTAASPGEAMAAARRARSRVLRSLWRGQRLAFLSAEDRGRWDRAISHYQATRSSLENNLRQEWQLPSDLLAEARARNSQLRSDLEDALDRALEVIASPIESSYSLRPLADGEVVLIFHPMDDGWLGFAEGPGGVVAKALGNISADAPSGELATQLLDPFADQLEVASTVRLLPYGELRDIDFHALPFAGEPLVVQRSVIYGLDLPTNTLRVDPIARALMVIDPNQDLPNTRRESDALRSAFTAHDVDQVHWLEGSTARGDAVRQLLPEVDLFHFAGHGYFDGWDSSLGLAEDSRLSVGDIFALPRVPPRVILSGCETGRSGNDALYRLEDAAGIGSAFLTAGSQEVIATQRPVDDGLAAELMAGLYPSWTAGRSAAEALRQTQITQWRQDPASDWASFRAIEP